MTKTRAPKLQTFVAKNGKLVIKPQDQESADILRDLTKSSSNLTEEKPKNPRLMLYNVEAHLTPQEIIDGILQQNPKLDIPQSRESIKPIFKRGPRDRHNVNWIIEVDPTLVQLFLEGPIYIGFTSCRTGRFEEVTQCLQCLGHGHPAKSCSRKEQICAHCACSGHKSNVCDKKDSTPKCINCKGNHNAMDRTCLSRTTAVANLLGRTASNSPQ